MTTNPGPTAQPSAASEALRPPAAKRRALAEQAKAKLRNAQPVPDDEDGGQQPDRPAKAPVERR